MEKIKQHKAMSYDIISIFTCSMFFFFGFIDNNYNLMMVMCMIMLIHNIIIGIKKIRRFGIFLVFNIMIFVFILSRPFISFMRGDIWWEFENDVAKQAMILIFLSICFIYIGAYLCNYCNKTDRGKKPVKNEFLDINVKKLSKLLFFAFLICFAADFYIQFDRMMFMVGKDYADVYVEYTKIFPIYIRILSACMPYALCFYLSSLPNKKNAYISLFIFIIAGVPDFVIGSRGTLVENGLFSIIYIIVRNSLKTEKIIWLGKFEKLLMVFSIPAIVMFLGAYNYIREDTEVPNQNPSYLFVDFFYKQGTSFDTLCEGIEYEKELRETKDLSYSFGDIIDTIKYGTLSQVIFNTDSLGPGNNIKKATEGNSMAHHLSYLVLQNSYLEGHGRGSSYILETYIDLGILGVIFFNLFLGFFTVYIMELSKKGFVVRVLILISLTSLFTIPRSCATSFIAFIINPQFWFFLITIYIVFGIFKLSRIKKEEDSFIKNIPYNNKVSLEELHKVELQILKDFVDICKNNNLNYYLGWGSCLGAVRHHGFIPWDDDIDIVMPLRDYNVFLKKYSELLGEKYFVENITTEKDFFLPFTKIKLNNSCFISKRFNYLNINWGIGLDIFPLIPYKNKIVSKLDLFLIKIAKLVIYMPAIAKNHKRTGLLKQISQIIYSFTSTGLRNKLFYFIIKVIKCDKEDFYLDLEEIEKRKIAIPQKIYRNGIVKEFENTNIVIPYDYESYLISLYGEDYYIIPDKDSKLIYSHNDIYINLEKNLSQIRLEDDKYG